jgi:hypothetical protein
MVDVCKEYNLKIGNDNYSITLKNTDNGEDNSILIGAKANKSLSYEGNFTLNELMMLSKVFRFCDNTNEALNIISKIFINNKSSLKKGNIDDHLLLALKINIPSGDEQVIELKLNKKEGDNSSNEELLQKIKLLEEENKNLKEEIQKLKKDNNRKDKIIESLKKNQPNTNINYNNINGGQEENNNDEEEIDENAINTDIIQTQEELDFVENRLKEINYFKNKNIKYQLLYKGTKNGDKSLYFHTKVDGIRNTLTLVKTKKGARFGGFTSENWNQVGGFGKCDIRAFCFSFNLKKIYNSQQNQIAIFCSDGYGPYFKGTNTIFGIYNNFFSQGGWCDYTTFSYSFGKFDKNFEITNGEQHFNIDEVEVFKVYTD